MANSNKKPINVMTKSALVAVMVGTGIGSQFANAQDDANKENDNKQNTTEKSQASIPVNVDDAKLKKAVKEAKDAGVKVDEEKAQDKTVKGDEADKSCLDNNLN